MNKSPDQPDSLLRKAEASLASAPVADATPHTVEKLLHDLQVHQIELEMQNEELRRTQELLEESRDRYVDLYEFAPVGYLMLSSDAKIVSINLTGAGLLGEERKKLLQRRFAHMVLPADRGSWQQYFTDTMQRVKSQACELTLQRSDGSCFDAHLDGRPGTAGTAAAMLRVTLSDISERKRMDRLLLDKNAELERISTAAENANRAKSIFLSNMSHELRTPLNSILGFAQLMESSSTPQTDIQRGRLGKITEAGWYLLELINEILDLATIESGRLSLVQEPVSLAYIVRKCEAMFEAQAQQRGIRITFHPFDESLLVNADRVRTKQVLINLLSNALKYNRPQGAIEVRCSATDKRVRISVKDSGIGLSDAHLAQLFQPFNRLGQEGGVETGTGIGLVLAKQLVELMGGEIGVESTEGVGSEFWIELSRSVAPAAAIADAKPAGQALQNLLNAAQRTVLCVEDDPASRMLIEQFVQEFPHLRILSVAAGNSGIELARAELPDVILLDINLPDISGIEVLRILREDNATRYIPVIAITANAIPGDLAVGLDAGFFEYLTKPIKINDLINVLDEALMFSELRRANQDETGQTI